MIYFARGGIFLSFDYLSFFSPLVFRRFYLCRRYIHSLDDRTETSISAVAIFRWRLTATSRDRGERGSSSSSSSSSRKKVAIMTFICRVYTV